MSQTKQREAMMDDYLKNPYNIVQEPLMARIKKFAYNSETGAIFGRTPSSWELRSPPHPPPKDEVETAAPRNEHSVKQFAGRRFASNEEVIAETDAYFAELEKSYYTEDIKKLEKRWTKCINLEGKIGLFYIIFYICLACLFAICLWVFYLTLDPRIPTWRLDESLIGTNPALGFRPMPDDPNSLSTLIWYKGTAEKDYKYWTETLREFLDVYKTPGKSPGRGENIFKCSYDQPPPPGKVCDIDVRKWDPCNYENHFHYHLQGPCIFIKLNKIYGWRPEYYNDTSALPENMPQSLKDFIKSQEQDNKLSLNTVWVSCEGENPADVENIGQVEYYPKPGFPGYFFPYENSVGYLSPLVAVRFLRPKNGILINVECKAWAKNIIHDRRDRQGVVHFELMID